ncbi:hypothetical protein P2318_18375 [Myxococcaceae bacterium GXIMD 01537]
MRPLPLILTLLAPILAAAREAPAPYEYYPERRSVSLLVGPGLGYTDKLRGEDSDRGVSAHLDVGASITVGYDRSELFFLARPSVGAPGFSLGLIASHRSFYGDESLSTFVDIGVAARLFSGAWVGPRIGFGLHHALSERVAVLGGLGLSLGFGSGLRLDAEAFTALQWRFPI